MRLPQRLLPASGAFLAAFSLLLCSGCYTPSAENLQGQYGYQPERSPVQIDASATVEVDSTMTPELEARLGTGQYYDNYRKAVAGIIRNDIEESGLFARLVPAGGAQPDYRVKIRSEESHPSGYRIRVRLQAFDTTTGKEIADHAREASASILLGLAFDKDNPYLQRIMTGLKADLSADLQQDQDLKKPKKSASQEELDQLNRAALSDLLAGSDRSVALARARNRALVAAKHQQLPGILRDRKTDELSALVVKIEQTILDLDHEGEVAKDQVQQSAAGSGAPETMPRGGGHGMASQAANSTSLDELRGLAICYRERIELLKPIAAALKEEIANRNR